MHLKTIIKSILILLISSNAFANETLIFALDIVRHGDRTPLFSIPKSNYKWIEGHGKLTAIGMQQMFQLGTHIRKKYVDDYQLLPKHYQNGTIFVSSTDYDRTLISAQSILLGLYPLGTGPILPNGTPALPEAFQAIPIHVKTWPKTKTCTSNHEKYFLSSAKIKKKDVELKNSYKRWQTATGFEVGSFDQALDLGDALEIYKLHQAHMPSNLNKNDIDKIIKIKQWGCLEALKTKEIARHCRGGAGLADVVNYLQKAARQRNSLKYVLLSDHDSTIGQIMTLLENPLTKWPPYASDLNFELFKTNAGNYIVRVRYNGEPLIIPSCRTKNCTLKQFGQAGGIKSLQ